MISLIAAVGKEGELGYRGDLIWKLPADLKYFKEVTVGHPVLMGHKTFTSLPKLLPGRKHIVLARDKEALLAEAAKKPFSGTRPEIEVVQELFEVLDRYEGLDEELFIIGGGNVYKQTIGYADKIYLTEIAADFPKADVYFPGFDKSKFKREVIKKGYENDLAYAFVVYTRQ